MFIMRAAELHAGGFECDAPTQSIQCDLQRQMHEAFKLIIGRLKLGEEDAADLRRRGVPSEIAEAYPSGNIIRDRNITRSTCVRPEFVICILKLNEVSNKIGAST